MPPRGSSRSTPSTPRGCSACRRRRLRLTWQVRATMPTRGRSRYQLASGAAGGELSPEEPVASDRTRSASRLRANCSARERRSYAVRIATAAGWTRVERPAHRRGGRRRRRSRGAGDRHPERNRRSGARCCAASSRSIAAPSIARLRLSALGLVDAWINGVRASDALLTPGWTSYQERILIDTVDVTGTAARRDERHRAGCRRGLVSRQLRVRAAHRDLRRPHRRYRAARGRRRASLVATDTSWTGGFGAVRSASIYDGTVTDLRLSDRRPRRRLRGEGWIAGRRHRHRPVAVRAAHRRTGPRGRGAADARLRRMAAPRSSTAARTSRAGCGSRCAAAPATPSRSATPRCSSRRATCTSRRCAAPRRPMCTSSIATASTCSSPSSRSTASGTRMSSAPRSSRPQPIAISSDLAPRSSFRSSHEALDQFHSNVSGRSATTSSRCRPTARSATSGSAGRATRRRSAPRPRR